MHILRGGLSVFLGVVCVCASAQDIKMENLRFQQDGRISFDYTIAKKHSNRERYDVKILTSADDFGQPLNIQLDDIPVEQKQTVAFKGSDHLPRGYSGALRIRLTAEATLYPIQVTSYSDKVKSSEQINVSWNDHFNSGTYEVKLTDGVSETVIASDVRGSSFSGFLPAGFSKGKYQLQVSAPANQLNTSDEMPFIVAGGLSTGIKLLGGAALAGIGVILAGGENPPPTDTGLPDAPGPPDNN